MSHSKIVGGSTAARVMACPGSVKLCQQMPPKESSSFANEGTLLHNAIAQLLDSGAAPETVVGTTYEGVVLDHELLDVKLLPALAMMDEIDPKHEMEFTVEQKVDFGAVLPDVFGSCDLLGKRDKTTVIVDWKFGDGVGVSAEESEQLMFYAAAARHTPETKWAFEGADSLDLYIGQPTSGGLKCWHTTPKRIIKFEKDLIAAVRESEKPDAKLQQGSHCKWCQAKPICPRFTGAVDRALKVKLDALDVEHINAYLKNADLLDEWIRDLRALASQMADNGIVLPDWKLVQKRAVRKWMSDDEAAQALQALGVSPFKPQEIISPAQAEKALKPSKQVLPEGLTKAESSGTTLVPRSDPRPEALLIGQQLNLALSNLA